MIRKTLMISAALVALAGCDSGPFSFSGGGQESSASGPIVSQFREALAGTAKHGLTRDLFFKGDLESASESDLRSAVLNYASALAMGKVDPTKIREVYTLARPKVDVSAGLEQALAENRLAEWLDSLAPQTSEYKALSQAFVHYADLASKTPDTNIAAGEPLKQGMSDERVPAVVEALKAGGYMTAEAGQQAKPQSQQQAQPAENASAAQSPASEYTAQVAEAVKRMQQDHGLKPDGVIGNDTLKAVNTSAKDRARQLAVSLERLRWLERTPPATRIDVNTAGAFLRYWRDGQQRDQRRVVVGEPGWETPPLGSPIFALVANPDWTVPDSIVEDEISKKSGAWLRQNNFTQKDGRWVQKPGPKSALGLVKFAMRNDESIYLHDTPAKALFSQDERHKSHGCVRVENAVQFAQLIAQDSGILDKFSEAMTQKDKETQVQMESEIPVRLLYHTAFLGADGKVQFVQDPYGWDNDVAAALGYERRQPQQRKQHAPTDFGP